MKIPKSHEYISIEAHLIQPDNSTNNNNHWGNISTTAGLGTGTGTGMGMGMGTISGNNAATTDHRVNSKNNNEEESSSEPSASLLGRIVLNTEVHTVSSFCAIVFVLN